MKDENKTKKQLINELVELRRNTNEKKRTNEEKKEIEKGYNRLRLIFEETVDALSSVLGQRDPFTQNHQRIVTKLACTIARYMNLPDDIIEGLRLAGLLHDIGKISVPTEILSKPGRLTDVEYRIVKTHVQIAYDILKKIDFPWPIAYIVLQHHERLNGSGYPQGLKAGEILLEAKILAVADVIEAMSSHRPYRPAPGLNKALAEIKKNKGVLYEPEVVDACLELFNKRKISFEEFQTKSAASMGSNFEC